MVKPSASPSRQQYASRLIHRSGVQSFLKTDIVLGDGMCGGAVLLHDGSAEAPAEKQRACFGVIEGIVPENPQLGDLQGCASFIEAADIRDWIEQSEFDFDMVGR